MILERRQPALPHMSDLDRCYAAALRILKYRFNSTVELRRKLAAKRFDQKVIGTTIARLRDEQWLDDERFASAYVRMRSQKKIGRVRIRRELIAAGIDDEAIDHALRAGADSERERESLAALCEKKIAIIARRHGADYVCSGAGRKKVTAYLLNLGYGMADVIDAVDEALRR